MTIPHVRPGLTSVIIALVLGASQLAFAQGSAETKEESLYNRLGGLAPISVVVSDFVDALVPDAELNKNPAIAASRKTTPAAYR